MNNDSTDSTGLLLLNETTNELALSTAQVIPLGIYCFIATTLGLLGNATVIYSSVRYDAIKLDKVSLIFVLNLAIADLLYILFVILPTTVTYMVGRYVLGEVYCFISGQLAFIPGSVNTLTILVITAYRLRLVTSPFFSITKTTANVIAAVLWCIATSGTVISLAYGSSQEFSPTEGKCMSTIYDNEAASTLLRSVVGLIVILPLFVTTIFNVILCVIATKYSRRHTADKTINLRALVMICTLSGLFIVSWVPYVVYSFLKSNDTDIPLSVELLGFHCIYINAFGNPILYSFTNKRFGNYVKGMLSGMICRKEEKKEEVKKRAALPTTSTAGSAGRTGTVETME